MNGGKPGGNDSATATIMAMEAQQRMLHIQIAAPIYAHLVTNAYFENRDKAREEAEAAGEDLDTAHFRVNATALASTASQLALPLMQQILGGGITG